MLVVSYDNEAHQDGFGAQLQRYMALMALCQKYNIDYYHQPLKGVNYNGLNGLLECNIYSESFLMECNERIKIDNSMGRPDDSYQIIHIYRIDEDTFQEIITKNKQNNQNIWLKICIAPILPEYVAQLPPIYCNKTTANDVFTVGIHVRRGDIAFLETDIRFLPTSYYANILKRILPQLPEKHRIEIYTEIPESLLIDRKVQLELDLGSKVPKEFKTRHANITLDSDLYNISELTSLPNVVVYNNEDVFTTLDRMINSDIFITSKSSLSAVASYLKATTRSNTKGPGTVIYKPFWVPMPATPWCKTTKDFNSTCIQNP